MASNSLRIDAELFEAARQHGELMSRSAALQIEHWARLGAALEATGLSVADIAQMLRGETASTLQLDAKQLWAFKRDRQARDIEVVRTGRRSNAQMSWFSGGRAKAARLVDSPY